MATEFRVEGIGIGEQETGINRIMPAMTAGANRISRGCDSIGVLNVFPNNFKLTGSNINSIGIGEGMASAYGYDLRNGISQTLNGTPPASDNKYYFIIAEWDLTVIPAMFRIKLHDNGTGANYTPTPQDNLITSPNGKYNMALYRLTVNTSGAIIQTQNWEALGIKTIGYTYKSEYADNYSNNGSLKTRLDALDSKNNEQDTKLANLGFRQGTITSSLIDASRSWWAKEGNVVYGAIYIKNINENTQSQTLQNIGNDFPKPIKDVYLATRHFQDVSGYMNTEINAKLLTNGNIVLERRINSDIFNLFDPSGALDFPFFCYNKIRNKP